MPSDDYQAIFHEASNLLGHIDDVINTPTDLTLDEREGLSYMRAMLDMCLMLLHVKDPNGILPSMAQISHVLWQSGAEKIGWLGEMPEAPGKAS